MPKIPYKNKAMKINTLLIVAALLAGLTSCGGDHLCYTPIGPTNFSIEPNSASYSNLNHVGGYLYLTGGHRGVVVVRTGLDEFVAYERTCPNDSTTAVEISADYGEAILECPECHSLFSVYADGAPMNGNVSPCPLYKYSTTYDGRDLWVY